MDLYSETLSKIYKLRGGIIDLRLDRMEQTLSLFDHPEKKFASFHIAGTNGKGSTAAMLHRVLTAAGYKTALYISPHLVSFAERIRIADEEITPGEVVSLADEIWERTTVARIPLTFFEFVTVMAFVYFARKAIDVGVVEVGLGPWNETGPHGCTMRSSWSRCSVRQRTWWGSMTFPAFEPLAAKPRAPCAACTIASFAATAAWWS